MNTFLKNLGAILVLLGVACLAVYYFSLPENYLLVTALALEVVGIATYRTKAPPIPLHYNTHHYNDSQRCFER